ncbi:MAG TPA: polyprenol monophosphomannose synthase [Thermodesulfobacteriota bacterium]|jgi:dolichol-phosphate mannosyltransferase|nr:polyprenol monophosphomannose synthase [Thermodesulfobacteriota bacterium]
MDLTVVIPTYNEAENIPILLDKVFREFRKHGLDGEVIVVDDDSPDGTWEIAQRLKSTYGNLEVLHRINKRGLSSAVLDGFQTAKGRIIGVMDADLSHPPEKIAELVKPIMAGESDFVIGSRYVEGGSTENWSLRRRVSSIIATLAVIGLTDIRDPMSGFFFFKKEVIEGVRIHPKGFKIGLEILVKGRYRNVSEIPISFRDRRYGKSKLDLDVILEDSLNIVRLYLCNLIRFFKQSCL